MTSSGYERSLARMHWSSATALWMRDVRSGMTDYLGASTLLQTALPSATRPAVIAVGLGYFAVIIGISIWAARRTRTANDFFVAGKGIGVIALTVASVSV